MTMERVDHKRCWTFLVTFFFFTSDCRLANMLHNLFVFQTVRRVQTKLNLKDVPEQKSLPHNFRNNVTYVRNMLKRPTRRRSKRIEKRKTYSAIPILKGI